MTRQVSSVPAGGGGPPSEIRFDAERILSEAVLSQLERICSNPRFQASEKRRVFLRFIVEETLSGRAENLKGYTIALAVFGREDSFDPQADPVVRLEARRLRRDLDCYYVDADQTDDVRISIPKGSYIPNFERRALIGAASDGRACSPDEVLPQQISQSSDGGKPAPRKIVFAAIGLVGLTVGLTLWMSFNRTTSSFLPANREPAVVVAPFETVTPGEDARYLALGMGQELVSNLFRFSGFRLYALANGSNQSPNLTSLQFDRNLGATYIVNGSIQTDIDDVRVTASVTNGASGEVVWTKTYDRPYDPRFLVKTQRDLANEIAAIIGQPYGVVATDVGDRSSAPDLSNMDSYICVLRGYGYRRTFLQAEFSPAMRCLEQTVLRDPEYSDAWAMLGWMHLDAGRLGFSGYNRQKEYAKALEAISRAVKLQPSNPLALKAMAAAYHFTGRYEESVKLTRQLVDLNPNDPEILAQLGWRLSVRGNFEEGVPILERAVDRTLNPPSWYFHFIAVDHYLKGDFEQSRKIAEHASLADSGFSQLLLAASNAELGNREGAQQALDKLERYEPLSRDPEAFLRRQGIADRTVSALLAGLKKAQGLVSQ